MEPLRALLALLCLLLAEAQTTVQRNRFAGKFAENMSKTSEIYIYIYIKYLCIFDIVVHVKLSVLECAAEMFAARTNPDVRFHWVTYF